MRPEIRRKLESIGAALLGAAATLLGGYVVVVELGARLIAGAATVLVMVPRGIVWVAVSLEAGMNGWTIAGRVASAAVDTLKLPMVTVSLIALELVGVGALFALRALLRGDVRASESKEMNP